MIKYNKRWWKAIESSKKNNMREKDVRKKARSGILCCRKYNAYEVEVGWIWGIKNLWGCQKHKV